MKLATYLDTTGVTGAAAARALRVSEAAVSRYRTGERVPEADVMRRIAKWSRGQVTADDFYGIRRRD